MLIAITGGVGSGKSAVMEILKSFGANVLSADEVNDEIIKDPEYIEKISKLFDGVVKDGRIDRVALGKKVFYDEKAMKKLNDLAHPLIIAETKSESQKWTDYICRSKRCCGKQYAGHVRQNLVS